ASRETWRSSSSAEGRLGTMRAVVCDGAGGIDVLRIGEIPDPQPAVDEVLIDVVAAGVNRADLLQRQGSYPPPPGAPGTIGLGVAHGARVLTTVGSKEKMEFCTRLGADVAINYKEAEWASVVQKATKGAGADVILDIMGAKYLTDNVKSLAYDGRLVVIGMQG